MNDYHEFSMPILICRLGRLIKIAGVNSLGYGLTIAIALSFTGICLAQEAQDTGGDPVQVVPAAKQEKPERKLYDKVKLKNGSIVSGKVLAENKQGKKRFVVVELPSGGIVKLDSGRLVRKVSRLNELDSEYAGRLKAMDPSDPNHHWAMYEWIRKKGKSQFSAEREYHLLQIAKLDPNDTRARGLLEYKNFDGRWVLKKHKFTGHGYTANEVPQQEVAINERKKSLDELIGERNKALNRWLKFRDKRSPEEVRQELYRITDDVYLLPIVEKATKEKNVNYRLMYLDAIARVKSATAQSNLVDFSIADKDERVRELALTLLAQDHFDPDRSVRFYTKWLTSKDNINVQRAAFAIGELGSDAALLPLIGALITTHKIKNPNAQKEGSIGMSTVDGQVQGMNTGGGPQTLDLQVKNEEVIKALTRITKENYGFNVAKWKEWYVKTYSLYDYDWRTGD